MSSLRTQSESVQSPDSLEPQGAGQRAAARGRSGTPYVVFGLGALTLAGLLAIGIAPRLERAEQLKVAQAALDQPRAVTWAKVALGEATGALTLPGTAAPIETAAIYARTHGFVHEFLVDIGDHVKAGQLLAVLDAPELEADAVGARARATEDERNAQLSSATAARHERLASVGVSSREQADEAAARANTAQASLASSRSEVTHWQTLLGFRYVRAPFAGVITRRNIEKGTLVTAGSAAGVTSLFEIARTETLKVVVDVPQTLAQEIQVGEVADVTVGNLTVQGKVARTAGALDAATRTLRTEVHVSGDKILAGSFVRVTLRTHAAAPPVKVPANALATRADGNFVYAIEPDQRLRAVKVSLGRELGTEAEVVAGLNGSERVVTNPAESLADGELVRLVTPQAAPKAADKPAPAAQTKPVAAGTVEQATGAAEKAHGLR